MTVADDVLKALNGLGKTPDEIADKLERGKITGYVMSSRQCPVSNYLKSLGHSHPVCYKHVYSIDMGLVDSLRTPDPVFKFIIAFDNGNYPNLIKRF